MKKTKNNKTSNQFKENITREIPIEIFTSLV